MRDFSLASEVPAPSIPIAYVQLQGQQYPVYVSEEWRSDWFERISTALFGANGGEDVLLEVPQGSYVGSVARAENLGLEVSGEPGPGYTATITLAQDIRVSAIPSFAGMAIGGNISVGGTVDGRDLSADGTKLDGIESGATADQTADEIRSLVNQAGNSNVFTDGLLNKLNAIDDLATRNDPDAQLRDRATHTGAQAISTVTGLQAALDGKVSRVTDIPEAETAHATTDQAGVNAALDALGARINQIIAALG